MLNLSHKNLIVYKNALELTKEVYNLTRQLPKDEMFGLSSQLKRAAVSVCSNLAEGAGRISKAEKSVFMRYLVAQWLKLTPKSAYV